MLHLATHFGNIFEYMLVILRVLYISLLFWYVELWVIFGSSFSNKFLLWGTLFERIWHVIQEIIQYSVC